jgi:hypothetical protein
MYVYYRYTVPYNIGKITKVNTPVAAFVAGKTRVFYVFFHLRLYERERATKGLPEGSPNNRRPTMFVGSHTRMARSGGSSKPPARSIGSRSRSARYVGSGKLLRRSVGSGKLPARYVGILYRKKCDEML